MSETDRKNSDLQQELIQSKVDTEHKNTSVEHKNIQTETQTTIKKKILPKKSSLGSLIEEVHSNTQQYIIQKSELTNDNLAEHWNNFISYIRPNAQNAFMNIIENQQPTVANGILTLQASNSINAEMIQLYKQEIIRYLIEYSGTKNLSLYIEIDRKELAKAVKLPRERVKDLLETDDKFRYLVQKLDLDLDI